MLRECIRAKKVYIPYARRQIMYKELVEPLLTEETQPVPGSTHGKADAEMVKFQDTLPLSTLIVFHQMAAKEAVIEIVKLRADPALMKVYLDKVAPQLNKPESKLNWGGSTPSKPSQAGAGGADPAPVSSGVFFGLFSSAPKPKPVVRQKQTQAPSTPDRSSHGMGSSHGIGTSSHGGSSHGGQSELDEDEHLMQEQQTTLHKYSVEATAAQDALFTLRVRVDTSAVLSVVLHKQPVIYLIMSMHSKIEMRKSNLSVLFDVDNFSIQDTISVNPVYPNLVCMLDSPQDLALKATTEVQQLNFSTTVSSPIISMKPKFCFAFESCGGKSSLKIKSC